MIAAFFFLLTASPFPFEVDSGPTIEVIAGSLFQDKVDDTAVLGGARISGFSLDTRDRVITAELQALTKTRFSNTSDGDPKMDYLFEGLLAAYEFYHPAAFRVAAGGGVERRESTWNPTIVYRGGVGFYFFSKLALFGDVTGRQIFRDNRRSAPLELSLSLQAIF